MFTHLVYTLTHSLPSVPHPTTQRHNPAAGCVGWGGGALGSTPLTALCPSPSLRRVGEPFRQGLLHLSLRRPLGAWLVASWPPPERADSTPGSGLIASAHLGCKRRMAHRPQQRGASPGGGNLRALGWRGEDPGRSVSRRTRGPELPAGKGGAQRRGVCVWAGEGETAHETAATWGLRRPDRSHGL